MTRSSALLPLATIGFFSFVPVDCATKNNLHRRDNHLYKMIKENEESIANLKSENERFRNYIADLEQVIEEVNIEIEALKTQENCEEHQAAPCVDLCESDDLDEQDCERLCALDSIQIHHNIQDVELDMEVDMEVDAGLELDAGVLEKSQETEAE